MNEWVEKSIEIANSRGYLDKLYNIYPVIQGEEREVSEVQKAALKRIFNGGDDTALVTELLQMEKFPYNDPYVAYLKKDEKFLEYNPKTVKRIARNVRKMGFEEMMKGFCKPKDPSKKLGDAFQQWLPKLGYPLLVDAEFESSKKGIVFLKGGDAHLRDFANFKLHSSLKKRPDFIAKNNDQYIIGEAKFLTSIGGGQDRGFDDAMTLLKGKKGNAARIAVLDGVVWVKSGNKMHKQVCRLNENALTALLLIDFLKSIDK